ncbi:hypothetical protein ACFXTO_030143 [Malus domestica]
MEIIMQKDSKPCNNAEDLLHFVLFLIIKREVSCFSFTTTSSTSPSSSFAKTPAKHFPAELSALTKSQTQNPKIRPKMRPRHICNAAIPHRRRRLLFTLLHLFVAGISWRTSTQLPWENGVG